MSIIFINPYRFATKLLLDDYPGAAAAYSLRNLTILSDAPVVRVRRSSDNTEQDFTAAQVTDGTLTTFCGAGNGFVRTWYDQSGNARHATQSTTGNQPQIVSSGAVLTSTNKPVLVFDGSNDFLRFTGAVPISTNFSAFGIFTKITHASNNRGFFSLIPSGASPDNRDWASRDGRAFEGGTSSTSFTFFAHAIFNGSSAFSNAIVINSTITVGSSFVFSAFESGGNAYVRINGANQLSDTYDGTPTVPNGIVIGARFDQEVGFYGNIRCQELILYGTNEYSNRVAIESSINAHYGVY